MNSLKKEGWATMTIWEKIQSTFTALLLSCILILSLVPTPASAATTKKSADEIVSAMSEEEKIAQLLMPDFRQWKDSGQTAVSDMTVLSDEVKQILQDYKFGGVILFANNVKQTEQTVRLTDDLQEANADGGNIPLLIATDQEGGSVVRLGSGCRMTGNMALGATRDEDAAFDTGDIMGSELHALGINVDYAPVMDTNDNPKNPVIGLRSFSDDPQLVARLGIQVMKGLQSNNIATALKHFPGHGNTSTDSHTGMPVVNKTMEQLKKVELVPFQAAIDEGADIIMTTHIQYPKIITEKLPTKNGGTIKPPATLSKEILTGLVRDEMGFDGVIVTDAMNMQGITDNFNEPEATLYAIKAGADMVVMPTILRSKADIKNKLDPIIDKIKTEAETDKELQSRIEESAKRIVQLKIDRDIMTLDNTPIDEKIANAEEVVGSGEHHDREREIADEAVTVIKNDAHILPIQPKENQNVLLIGQYSNEMPALQFGLEQLMNEDKINAVKFKTMFYYPGNYTDEQFQTAISDADYVIAITETSTEAKLAPTNWVTSMPTKIVNWSKSSGKPCVLVSIDKPYDVANYPSASTILAVYGSSGMDPTEGGQRPTTNYGPNIPAALDIIFGAFDPVGTLPVNIPVIKDGVMSENEIQYERGYGLTGPLTNLGNANITAPEKVKMGQTFEVKVSLSNLQNLNQTGYTLKIGFDSLNFTAKESNDITIEGSTVAAKVTPNEEDTSKAYEIKLNFAGKNVGSFEPIQSITIEDDDGNTFTPSISRFLAVTVEKANSSSPSHHEPATASTPSTIPSVSFKLDTTNTYTFGVGNKYYFLVKTSSDAVPSVTSSSPNVSVAFSKKVAEGYLFEISGVSNGTATITAQIGNEVASFPVVVLASSIQSDTTFPFSVKVGSDYRFRMIVLNNSSALPHFTVGNGNAFTTRFIERTGNNYYFSIRAVGVPGTSTGVYTTMPGEPPVRQCVVSIA